jgi:hypothetical protein
MNRLGSLLTLAALALMPVGALAKSKDPVKVTSASALKGAQRVVVGQFTVGFLMERKDSAKAGGGLMGNGFGGRSTTRSTLVGVGPAEMQAIADAAYTDFVAKLTAAGFEVVDRAAYAADPAIAKTKTVAAPYEASTITGKDDKAKALFVSASQTAPLRMMPMDVSATGFGAMGMIMSGNQIAMAQAAYAKANDVRIVNAVYYVDFADSDEYGGWFRSSSAVKVNGSLALLPDQTKITVVGPNYKNGVLALADPVAVPGDFFTAANTTSTGSKVSQGIANAIGILGGVGTNSTKKLTFTARADTFVPGAIQAASDANATLIAKFAAMR